MSLLLTVIETRVLGALIEKDITTPDYYPLSLNALVNACNQKNNRDPVMTLDEAAVSDALSMLQEKRLAGPASDADSRVTKYEHRLQEVLILIAARLLFYAFFFSAVRKLPENSAAAPTACTASRLSTTLSPLSIVWRSANPRW